MLVTRKLTIIPFLQLSDKFHVREELVGVSSTGQCCLLAGFPDAVKMWLTHYRTSNDHNLALDAILHKFVLTRRNLCRLLLLNTALLQNLAEAKL